MAHLKGIDDILVKVEPLAGIISSWEELLSSDLPEEDYETIRRHERSGRPLGSEDFLDRLETLTSRLLRKKKPGPKKNN